MDKKEESNLIFACISIILTFAAIITFKFVNEKYYPYFLYVVALFAVYSTTMLGSGAVGSDICAEVSVSREALQNGWNINILAPEVTSFVVGALVPVLAKIFFIDVVWVYKAILPLIFALCPVILYLTYAKQIEKWKAFVGALFFIIMPVYFLEISTIGKSMVAEVFLALAIYALVTDWSKKRKFIVILCSLALALWAHYSVGIVGLAIFFVIGIVLFATQLFRKWELWKRRNTSPWLVLLAVVVVTCMGFGYYNIAGQGTIVKSVKSVAGGFVLLHQQIVEDKLVPENAPPDTGTPDLKNTYINYQPPLIRTALGLDFSEADTAGRAFRIIQFITQLLVIIGCVYILFRHKRYKLRAEFIAGMGACAGIIFLCIVIPGLSGILNPTRFYHLSLFCLAITFPIGVDAIVDLVGVTWKKFQ